MHQTARAVAPLHTDPKWPQGYTAVLREAGAQEKNIPYCVAWVQRFFAMCPGRKWRDLSRSFRRVSCVPAGRAYCAPIDLQTGVMIRKQNSFCWGG